MGKIRVRMRWFGIVVLMAACCDSLAFRAAQAQSPPWPTSNPEELSLLSAKIQAESAYMRAVSQYLEEKQNLHGVTDKGNAANFHSGWVVDYFEARSTNRFYRLKENPNYLDREKHLQDVRKRRLLEASKDILAGDPTDDMNWLVRELSTLSIFHNYVSNTELTVRSSLDNDLQPSDINHFRLREAGMKGGKSLVFRADQAKTLQIDRWPRVMQGEDFQASRENFELERDALINEVQNLGQVSPEQERRLMKAVDRLTGDFNNAYPPERRTENSGTFVQYAAGKRFLQALAGAVYRAIETNDTLVFQGSYRFEGKTVLELVNHLCRNGLEFAPPEAGDETAYRRVFSQMRDLYYNLEPNGRPESTPFKTSMAISYDR